MSPLHRTVASATPVLNTPGFDSIFHPEKFKSYLAPNYLLKSAELVLLPGDKICVVETMSTHIHRIKIPFYAGNDLFIDIRTTKPSSEEEDYKEKRFQKDSLIPFLRGCVGLPYVWGGNYGLGIPEMLELYPPHSELDPLLHTMWTFRGLDCTGLLYWATEGATPRNSGDLAKEGFGKILPVEGCGIEEICKMVSPLDLFIWKGHIFIVIDKGHVIESRWPSIEDFDKPHQKRGVVITPLQERLEELFLTRRPINDPTQLDKTTFVVKTSWVLESS